MEGRIEDPKKAETMAYAGKAFRERAILNDDPKEDQRAAQEEQKAGEEYDLEQRKLSQTQVEADTVPEGLHAEALIGAGKKFYFIFKARNDQELSCLMEPEAVSLLASGFRNLEEASQSKNLEEFTRSLQTIMRALEGIGRADTRGALREDDDSLGKVIFALKNLQEACLDTRPRVAQNPSLSIKLDKINDMAERAWLFVAKRRDLLRSYLDRRY